MKMKKPEQAEHTFGIYILNGTKMFRLNRMTGETWFYAQQKWWPVGLSEIGFPYEPSPPLDKLAKGK